MIHNFTLIMLLVVKHGRCVYRSMPKATDGGSVHGPEEHILVLGLLRTIEEVKDVHITNDTSMRIITSSPAEGGGRRGNGIHSSLADTPTIQPSSTVLVGDTDEGM